MNKISDRDLYKLNTIIENIKFCEENIKGIDEYNFLQDIKTQYSLIMALQIIGETSIQLDENIKKEYNNIQWEKIKGLRNIISHDYGGLILDSVFSTIKYDLPKLKLNIEKIINNNIQANNLINIKNKDIER